MIHLLCSTACQRLHGGSNVLLLFYAAEALITPPEHDERRALLYGVGAVLMWSTVATGFKLGLKELAK